LQAHPPAALGTAEAPPERAPGPTAVPPPPPFTPYVTYTLLVVTVLVFVAQQAGQALFGFDLVSRYGMKVNELIARGQIWRLITPMFLHGSLLHIGFNMYALFIFGPGLERQFGRGRFLTLYALSAFAGNVASLMFSAANSLGSSTAIFGLLGAQGVFIYQNRAVLGTAARRALNNIIFIAVINLVIGLSPQIDNWGHIGGLLGGTLFTWLAGPLLRVEGIFPAVRIRDDRDQGDVFRAALWVGLLFALLAAATIFLRSY
jgi:membrane associated rhomboid family serine protease